eukprot:1157009-Pelagomonas_calceolata.AAC.10
MMFPLKKGLLNRKVACRISNLYLDFRNQIKMQLQGLKPVILDCKSAPCGVDLLMPPWPFAAAPVSPFPAAPHSQVPPCFEVSSERANCLLQAGS